MMAGSPRVFESHLHAPDLGPLFAAERFTVFSSSGAQAVDIPSTGDLEMHDQDGSRPLPWLYRYRSSSTFIIGAVCVAIFNDVFLFGTIIPILPYALPQRIHVDYKNVQLYISILLAAYGGATLIGSVLFGWLGDKVRRRQTLFFSSLCTLLGATLLLAFGRHIAVLVLGRILQGLSAALVWTSSLALLSDLLGPERRGEAMGFATLGTSVGTTSAPLLGGLVYSYGGYHAVSLMGILTVGVAIIMAALVIEPRYAETIEARNRHATNGSAKGKANGNGHFESHTEQRGYNVTHDVDEQTALLPQKHQPQENQNRPSDNPVYIYLLLLRSPRILAAMGGVFSYAFVMISMEGLIPLFVKDTFNWSSLQAALTFLSWIVPGFLSPVIGKATDRYGSRWIAVFGLLFSVPPLILLRLVTQDSTGHKVLLCVLLSLLGLGFVCVLPACLPDLSAAAVELKSDRSGDSEDSTSSSQAFGLFMLAFSTGGFVGPPATALLKTKVSWATATLILACVCVCISIPIAFKTSAVPRRPKNSDTDTLEDNGVVNGS